MIVKETTITVLCSFSRFADGGVVIADEHTQCMNLVITITITLTLRKRPAGTPDSVPARKFVCLVSNSESTTEFRDDSRDPVTYPPTNLPISFKTEN